MFHKQNDINNHKSEYTFLDRFNVIIENRLKLIKTEIDNMLLKRKNILIILLLDPSLIKAAKRRVKFI